ncbi:hypothetical protein XaCFBP7622_10690 [Xanthomonas arboricola]|nr:hypothetical protein XaCFBP7622_10690 [Xanthomonas arboricola]
MRIVASLEGWSSAWVKSSGRRGRSALTACGARREPVPGGSVAASMPPHGPATRKNTASGR